MRDVAAKLHGIAARIRLVDWGKMCRSARRKATVMTTFKLTRPNNTMHSATRRRNEPNEASADEATITPIDLWGHLNPPELPRGLLPKVIEQFALVQGGLMGVDPGGLAVAALVVCAAAITDDIELQVKKHDRGWTSLRGCGRRSSACRRRRRRPSCGRQSDR